MVQQPQIGSRVRKVPSYPATLSPDISSFCPHLHLYKVVALYGCLLPCIYRKILGTLRKLTELCAIFNIHFYSFILGGRSKNTLRGILNQMIDQALEWFEQAYKGLMYEDYVECDGGLFTSESSCMTKRQFKYREFAWWPLGKIAYMMTSLRRKSHVARDSRGYLVDMYAANCMDDAAREQAIVSDFAAGSGDRAGALKAVKILINYFSVYEQNLHWSTTPADTYPPRQKAKDKAWLTDVFSELANIDPTQMDKRVGYFPNCAPQNLLMKEMSLRNVFKPKGWEAVKCLVAQAGIALRFPLQVYRGHRCEIWRSVIGLGLEAVSIAVSITLFANPAVGVALITVMKTMNHAGAGKLLVSWMWRSVKRRVVALGMKIMRMDTIATYLGTIFADMAPKITHLLVKHGWNVGQGKESILDDPMWIECLNDYVKFMLVTLINVLLTFIGDPTTLIKEFLKVVLFKAVGCAPEVSVWSFGTIRHQCSPWNKDKFTAEHSATKDFDTELRKLSQTLYTEYKNDAPAPPYPTGIREGAPLKKSKSAPLIKKSKSAAVSDSDAPATCLPDMEGLERVARSIVRPDMCACGGAHARVMRAVGMIGYGGLPAVGKASTFCLSSASSKTGIECVIPGALSMTPSQFAAHLNQGDNAAKAGLTKVDVESPYDAPAGAIVIVGGGSPGTTNHPTSGDISIKGSGDTFWNDGSMSYGGRSSWRDPAAPSGQGLLGVYIPLTCASASAMDDDGSTTSVGAPQQDTAPDGCPADATVSVSHDQSWSGLPSPLQLGGLGSSLMYNGQPQYEADNMLLRYDGEKYGLVSKTDGSAFAFSQSVYLPLGSSPWELNTRSSSGGGRSRRQDSECSQKYATGVCKDDRAFACTVSFVSSLCPGSANMRCCPSGEAKCSGECIDTLSQTCSVGTQTGKCPGASNVRCCPSSGTSSVKTTPAPKCSGQCADTNKFTCSGAAWKSNLCPGAVSDTSICTCYACAHFVGIIPG